MTFQPKVILFILGLGGLLSGCSTTPSTYHWGSYEPSLYEMYLKPGSATPIIQIDRLLKDIEQAKADNKPVAPGVYAHLGFMYSLQGNKSQAIQAFNQEKALFPESATLIDGMLKRAEQASQ